ncbi:hypothetical protein pb186bvf_012723 [Paramecium bursaria]
MSVEHMLSEQSQGSKLLTSKSQGRFTLTKDIKDSMLQTHFSKLVEKNEQYLNHLQGNCICGNCICGQCKCPKMLISLDFKKGQESLYQKEFVQHGKSKYIPLFDHNATFKNTLPMDMQTIQRQTFPAHRPQKIPEDFKPDQKLFLQPFHSGSTYQIDFASTGGVQSLDIKPPFHPTVVDMPFNTTSTYHDNFYTKPIPKEQFLLNSTKSSFKNPISPELPFLHQSSNNRFYKPYATGKLDNPKQKTVVQSLPSFEGQFQSTTQKDFNDKNPKKCPSRIYLNSLYRQQLQGIA